MKTRIVCMIFAITVLQLGCPNKAQNSMIPTLIYEKVDSEVYTIVDIFKNCVLMNSPSGFMKYNTIEKDWELLPIKAEIYTFSNNKLYYFNNDDNFCVFNINDLSNDVLVTETIVNFNVIDGRVFYQTFNSDTKESYVVTDKSRVLLKDINLYNRYVDIGDSLMPSTAMFSHDGRYVLYMKTDIEYEEEENIIILMDIENGHSTEIRYNGIISSLIWLSNPDYFLITCHKEPTILCNIPTMSFTPILNEDSYEYRFENKYGVICKNNTGKTINIVNPFTNEIRELFRADPSIRNLSFGPICNDNDKLISFKTVIRLNDKSITNLFIIDYDGNIISTYDCPDEYYIGSWEIGSDGEIWIIYWPSDRRISEGRNMVRQWHDPAIAQYLEANP